MSQNSKSIKIADKYKYEVELNEEQLEEVEKNTPLIGLSQIQNYLNEKFNINKSRTTISAWIKNNISSILDFSYSKQGRYIILKKDFDEIVLKKTKKN